MADKFLIIQLMACNRELSIDSGTSDIGEIVLVGILLFGLNPAIE